MTAERSRAEPGQADTFAGHHRVAASEALAPEAAGFADLYDRHARLLRFIAVRDFHVPFADAEALVHDIFANYFANPGVVRGDLKAYLRGAIRNECLHYRRRRDREQAVFCDVDDVGREDNVSEAVAVRLAVTETLARLRPKCRDALRCFHLEGKSMAAIAVELHASPNYVRQLLHHCRRTAREIFVALTRVE